MPCDKFMEQPLEERLELPIISVDASNIAYEIRINPQTSLVQYRFQSKSEWVDAD
jgi:hypothetical protein